MVWQDIVISICQIIAVFSLIPSITSKDKPALKTSVMNMAIVFTIATTLLTLRLWIASLTAYMIALSWTILAIQKWKIDKKSD